MKLHSAINVGVRGLLVASFVFLLLVLTGVDGNADRSAARPIERASQARAGEKHEDAAAEIDTGTRSATLPDAAPIVGDLANPALRAWLAERQEAVRAVVTDEPAAEAAPLAPSTTRRIELDTPSLRIVNQTERWVFIPNPEKMPAAPESPPQ